MMSPVQTIREYSFLENGRTPAAVRASVGHTGLSAGSKPGGHGAPPRGGSFLGVERYAVWRLLQLQLQLQRGFFSLLTFEFEHCQCH